MGANELAELLVSETASPDVPRDLRRQMILQNIAACRTPQLGGRILSCENCGTRVVYYNGCHQRGCPKCAEAVRYQWRQRVQSRMLHTGHCHLVFSGPEELTSLWRREPKVVIDALFAAVDRSLKLESRRSELTFGIMLVFHSHGSGMCYKAHLHCLITCGGLTAEGKWREHRFLDTETLQCDFHRLALAEFEKRVAPNCAQALRHSPAEAWRVYARLHPDGASALIRYFARSLHGVVVDLEEPFRVEEREVHFLTHHEGESRRISLERSEFLNRYFAHIPPKGAVTVRHYGLYANRRGALLEKARSALPQETQYLDEPAAAESGERCPRCAHQLTVAICFGPEELPPPLRFHLMIRGSPCAHGEIIPPILASA